jgi:calcineurin-like phosphoesterase family protein
LCDPFRDLQRRVGGTVFHHYDLVAVARIALRQQALQGRLDFRLLVVGRHDDADEMLARQFLDAVGDAAQ